MRPALYNRRAVQPFFDLARDRRADVALIGDSNMANNGGWQCGWGNAWPRRLGLYATPVCAVNAQGGFGSLGTDYCIAGGFYAPVPPDGGTAAPPAFDALRMASDSHSFPYGYVWQPAASGLYLGESMATFAGASASMDPTAHQRWWFDYGVFASGGGSFTPSVRGSSSLDEWAASTPSISTVGASDAIAYGSLDLQAGATAPDSAARAGRQAWWEFAAYPTMGLPLINGNFFSQWNRVELPAVRSGVGVSTLLYQGGLGTRDAALALQGVGQTGFLHWLDFVTRLQVFGDDGATPTSSGDRVMMFQIIQGQNDTAQSANSVGPNPAPSNTPAGSVDNHAACITRIRALWAAAGYDPNNLYFLIGPYHPQEVSRRKWGLDLDAALRAYSDTTFNVAVAARSGGRISTTASYNANGWYQDQPDAHLASPTAYTAAAHLAAGAVLPTPTVKFKAATGLTTLYCRLLNRDGYPWDGVNLAVTPHADSQWANYAVPLAEAGTSGVYSAVFPASLPPGRYTPDVRVQGTPGTYAIGDAVATGTLLTPVLDWDGTTAGDDEAGAEAALALDRRVGTNNADSPAQQAAQAAAGRLRFTTAGNLLAVPANDVTPATVIPAYDGPIGLTVTPYTATLNASPVAVANITVRQSETVGYTVYVKDSQGNPVTLTGKVVRFVAYSSPDGGVTKTTLFNYDTTNHVSVANGNEVTITFQGSDTANLFGGNFYNLWDVTDGPRVVMEGGFSVKGAQLT